jgi:hypothetical protein
MKEMEQQFGNNLIVRARSISVGTSYLNGFARDLLGSGLSGLGIAT